MKNTICILILLLKGISFAFTQEKRIALVIGNSDYQYQQKLKNPVRDAILMAETLESLDFDVILDTNITTKRKFVKAIIEFGAKRESYDVGFIFYAGHGMQVNGKNYLLPTEEDFEDKEDLVEQFAVGAEMIMEYLTKQTDQINVLILDACRNNPIQNTRSVGVGGLAGMQATGSLIAFSTTAGNVAKDGYGDHSIYCMSLVKNMLKEGIDIYKVFTNVRKEVLQKTGQSTVEYNQLQGDFYLKRTTYTDDITLIDSLIETGKQEQYSEALEIAISIINEDNKNKEALILKAELYALKDDEEQTKNNINLALKYYPNDAYVLYRCGAIYGQIGDIDEAFGLLNKAIEINPNDDFAFSIRGSVFKRYEKYDLALADYCKAIELDPEYADYYNLRASVYRNLNQEEKTLLDYTKAIELDPDNQNIWYGRGYAYYHFNRYTEALDDFQKVLELDSLNGDAINWMGVIYRNLGDLALAIKTYERGIALEEINPQSAAFCYRNRAMIYETLKDYDLAIDDLDKAINLDPKNGGRYFLRANIYRDLNKKTKALIDYTEAIKLDPKNQLFYFYRGGIHYQYQDYNEALDDFQKVLELDSLNGDAITYIGVIYQDQGEIDMAIQTYEQGIALEKINPQSAAYSFRNRGSIYESQEKYNLALTDYTKSIQLDSNNPFRYQTRANLYFALNDENKALDDYSKAIELDPENTRLWYNRGTANYHFNRYTEALDDFQKVLELDSLDVNAINYIGVVYKEKRETDLAIQAYERGIALEEIAPKSAAFCYSNRALIYEDQEKYDLALADYTRAKELDLNNPDRYLPVGRLLRNYFNKPYEALNLYTSAINIDSSNIQSWADRAMVYGQSLHDYQSAIKDCKFITAHIDSNNALIMNWIGVFYHRLGDDENAQKYYKKVIQKHRNGVSFDEFQINGGVAWCYNNLGVYSELDNDYEAAQKFYDIAVEIDANEPERYFWRGWFYFNCLNENDLALLDIQKAIDLNPENGKWLICKANMLERANLWSESKEIYDLAKKSFPEDENINLERARFLGLSGNLKSSQKAFKKLENLKTKNSKHLNYQIEIYIKKKDFNEAKKLIEECIELFPSDTLSRMYLADIYFEEQNYSASCMNYTYLISMMENNEQYLTYMPDSRQVTLSELYVKQAKTFEQMNNSESQCDALKKAVSNLKNMYGIFNKKELQSELENKIQSLCNP
jgi:tetratricopeptide (TPR) repeat protein